MTTTVALIPARAGSKRVPGKNLKHLGGRPLVSYTIAAARDSGVFNGGIWVSSEDAPTRGVAAHYGAMVIDRPAAFAQDDSPDILWVTHALQEMERSWAIRPQIFALLRPTSPFRSAATIQQAFRLFTAPDQTASSLRAVEPVRQHPGKMWRWLGPGYPLSPYRHELAPDGTPWHSMPTQGLEKLYVQNSSLEFAWTSCVETTHTITGNKVLPFFTEGYEGVAIDEQDDWDWAEWVIATGRASLPDPTHREETRQ